MAQLDQIPEEDRELDILEREDRCRKALRTVTKAIIMRLFVTGLLIWVLIQTSLEPWIIGLMALVALINLTGLLPLYAERRKRWEELKQIIAEDEG